MYINSTWMMAQVVTNAIVTSTSTSQGKGSGKAGLSWPQQERTIVPVIQFFGSNSTLTWWFNWNKNYGIDLFTFDKSNVRITADFVPMQYDFTFLNNKDYLDDSWGSIMGYNEPDLHSSTKISTATPPLDAATNWKIMYSSLRAQKPNCEIWSPAVAGDKQWLHTFFNAICPDGLMGCAHAPSHLQIHVFTASGDEFIKRVTDYHNEFPELNIVVSEFACYDYGDAGHQPSIEDVTDFMDKTTTWLDATPWIYRYAWFGAAKSSKWLWGVSDTNRLMEQDGSMSPLGKQYVSGGRRSASQ